MEQRHATAMPPAAPEVVSDKGELRQLFELLSPDLQRRCLPVIKWMACDGRPETDPRNNDPWWAEFERRRMSG